MPISPLRLLLFILAFAVVAVLVQLGAIRIAFDKLGLSPESAGLLLLCTLGGSLLNLPLFSIRAAARARPQALPPELARLPFFRVLPVTGRTMIAVNVGGAVVPAAFSLFLLTQHPLNAWHVATAVALVAGVAYLVSRPLPGIGVGMPLLVAPLVAVLAALLLDPQQRAPLAYIGGSMGVLLGADFMRLRDIGRLGAPVAVIGGAGSFDGVYLSGLIAVMLA